MVLDGLYDFDGIICIPKEHHMFEYFAESNQGKEPLNHLCNFYDGNDECRKNILQNEGVVFRYKLLRQCQRFANNLGS